MMSFISPTRVRHALLSVVALLGAVTYAGRAGAGDLVFRDDFEGGVAISWVRQNTDFASGAFFVLQPAIVTASKLTNGNSKLTLFLQVPAANPAWAAIEAFGDAVGVAPAVGDCVRVAGTVTAFKGATEMSPMTWTSATPLDCGNSAITPFFVSISDIATDTTSITAGNQPGALAEAYESALLTLSNLKVQSTYTGGFNIHNEFDSTGTYLLVDGFLYQSTEVVGTHFSAITGVLQELDSLTDPVYQLLPRGAADIVVGP
jgi:hypothetical protein